MELGGGGWSWVEVGAQFSNTHIKSLASFKSLNLSNTTLLSTKYNFDVILNY